MNKNKWRVFLLDRSLLRMEDVSVLTLGILDFIFVNPVHILYGMGWTLCVARRDYVSRGRRAMKCQAILIWNMFLPKTNFLSAKLFMIPCDRIYEDFYFEPEQYPSFFSRSAKDSKTFRPCISNYDILSCIFLFHAASCFGWIMEMLIHLMRDGTVADICCSPWLPLRHLQSLFWKHQNACSKTDFVFFLNFIVFSFLQYIFSFTVELFQIQTWFQHFSTLTAEFISEDLPHLRYSDVRLFTTRPELDKLFSKLSKDTNCFLRNLNSLFITMSFNFDLSY